MALSAGPKATPPRGLVLASVAIVVLPLASLFWLLRYPAQAPSASISFEHLVVVLNVSVLAGLVAVLVGRAALQQHALRVVLLALGFVSMGGLFSVHALATPG